MPPIYTGIPRDRRGELWQAVTVSSSQETLRPWLPALILASIAVFGLHAQQPSAQARPPCAVPTAPTELVATIEGARLTFNWTAPSSGDATNYSVEFGNASGSTYLGTIDTGSGATTFQTSKDPGIFFVRVRGANRCGAGPASNEVRAAVEPGRMSPRMLPDVVVARRTAARNTYFPTAATMKNGEIVVVYYDSPDHVSRAGRISMVRSRDQGRTWSEPTVVIDGPVDTRDPNIQETARGTWLVSYFESDTTQAPSSLGVSVIRSDDQGREWSAPVKIGTTLRGAATSAKIVQLDNGDLLIPIFGARPGAQEAVAAVVRSADDGRTWPVEGETIVASAAGLDFVEPALGYLGGDRLIAMIRTEGRESAGHESYSLDGGHSWSAVSKTAFIAQASDLLPITKGPQAGFLVHTWSDQSGRYGESRPTMMQTIRFRTFPETRWAGRPLLLHQGHCWNDEGYPSSVLLDDGRILTVYYDACAGYIGGTFSVLIDPAKPVECMEPPPAPANLKVTANSRRTVSLAWSATSTGRGSYVFEAGTTPGGVDAMVVDLGRQTFFKKSQVGAGTYYARVRKKNACGTSVASNEVVVVVP